MRFLLYDRAKARTSRKTMIFEMHCEEAPVNEQMPCDSRARSAPARICEFREAPEPCLHRAYEIFAPTNQRTSHKYKWSNGVTKKVWKEDSGKSIYILP